MPPSGGVLDQYHRPIATAPAMGVADSGYFLGFDSPGRHSPSPVGCLPDSVPLGCLPDPYHMMEVKVVMVVRLVVAPFRSRSHSTASGCSSREGSASRV